MPFVVDASVAVSWLMPDERDKIAEAAWTRIANDRAMVPAVWWFEVRNALIVGERRGRLDGEKTAEALRLVKGLPIAIDTEVDEDVLMRLARTLRLTVYDAAYLELAVRRKLPLATLDDALAAASKAELVELIGYDIAE